ncbi:hypothetical protein JB92DRAFT_3041988 [Gautieria morchelliformis]|nr:hypothetical protein JB92DRAFT_3041988 [Gautieria morchelliformis]
MYSFGFEAAWKRCGCLQAATAVVKHLIDMHAPLEILRYALDCFFVMGEFCACSCSRCVGCRFFFCGCSE